MNQKEFCETTKHNPVVIIVSVLPRVPIMKSYLQFISSWHLLQCYTSLLSPLVGGMYKHFLTAIRFSDLPSNNPLTIGIGLLQYSIKYLFFQPRCARCMYDVVYIIVFLLLSNLHPFYSVYFVFTWKASFPGKSVSVNII